MNMRIKGTGRCLPEKIFTNDDIAKIVDTSDEWIKDRTGIGSRHMSTGETVSDLASGACIKALEKASVKAEDVDIIIVATCSPEQVLPCVACQVQNQIGAVNAVAYDINAACSGFMFALNTVYTYLSCGIYKNALVVGTEVLSKIVDWSDRNTCILFGDGAGAVYVEAQPDEKDGYLFVQHANGTKGNVLECSVRDIVNPLVENERTTGFIGMDGREIFKFAVGQVPVVINEVLKKAELKADDIDYFILHQANYRIISSIAKRVGQDIEKFPTNVERVGNMSSASIPVLLDECNEKGMFKEGMKLVLSGFGAGLTYGATVFTW